MEVAKQAPQVPHTQRSVKDAGPGARRSRSELPAAIHSLRDRGEDTQP